jgi:3-dehydroquinate synthase
MTAPIDIPVRAGRPRATYSILIADGLLADLGRHLRDLAPAPQALLVSSPRIWALHGPRIQAALPGTPHVLIPDGERAKHLRTVSRVYDALVAAGADRQTMLVVVGGGVLGDLAGFAAASYLRGIPLVHVPTTVVAQVDSAIGGKVGVNHPLGKNLIGAFYPPRAVLSDPALLLTLSAREYRAGLYEVVKYGVISSPRLFARLESSLDAVLARERKTMTEMVAECSRIKARVVMADEHETGERRILNFGHTAGHALEAITNYRRFRHGEAVGHGMLAAADIAHTRGVLTDEPYGRLRTLMERLGALPPVEDLSIGECLAAMQRDKKVVRGTLHFVLPVAIGKTMIVSDVTTAELRNALRRLGLRRK